MTPNNDFSRLELSRSACKDNYNYFRSKLKASTKLLILLKANAYGHGSVEFASLMQELGADYFAIAYPIEGVELRKAGIQTPIIVLTAGTDFYDQIIDYSLEPSIPNIFSLKAFVEVLRRRNITQYPIHIKLDSGMHRLGFMSGELSELTEFLSNCPEVKVKSIFSHLAVADELDKDEYTLRQVELFKGNADKVSAAIGYRPMYHILNSAGIERFPQYQFDMVRLGIGIYGVSPVPGPKLSPVGSLKCKILQIKHLRKEDGRIGYGMWGEVAPEGTTIATLPLGYADGINRHLGRGRCSFLLNGKRVPTIGNICMDMCMVDITGVDAKEGDTVTIFGQDLSVCELSDALGTIPYEILTSIPLRVERIVVD